MGRVEYWNEERLEVVLEKETMKRVYTARISVLIDMLRLLEGLLLCNTFVPACQGAYAFIELEDLWLDDGWDFIPSQSALSAYRPRLTQHPKVTILWKASGCLTQSTPLSHATLTMSALSIRKYTYLLLLDPEST